MEILPYPGRKVFINPESPEASRLKEQLGSIDAYIIKGISLSQASQYTSLSNEEKGKIRIYICPITPTKAEPKIVDVKIKDLIFLEKPSTNAIVYYNHTQHTILPKIHGYTFLDKEFIRNGTSVPPQEITRYLYEEDSHSS